ncbi:hypothetical protein AV530_010388 [Patagioenas fasciata monilis]|uniref:Uncharacterized protein n=1 Tax=Patagioenas fasciata monilis TaxID=372326 RepID=A0A1V4KER6_PATFA|nr:hypothetical protein AV530_010388 [Patagioenas fasciata monilis]
MKGPSLETQMVEDEIETTSEELPPHLREEPPEDVSKDHPQQQAGGLSHKLLQITAWLNCTLQRRNPQAQQSSSKDDDTQGYHMSWAISFCTDFLDLYKALT